MELLGPYLQPILVDILRLSLWLAILAVIFVPLERLFAAHPQKILRKGIGVDLVYYFLSSLLPALFLSTPLALVSWAVHRAVPGGFLEAAAALPLWARLLAGMVAAEVGFYWGHRWSHEVPFLWRFHSIHHSAAQLDFLVHTRAHPVDMVFSRLCALVPIYVLGLGGPADFGGSQVPVLATLFITVWGFFIHANIRWRLGPLEWLIATPAFHHWHHTLDGPINRNYASTLPWLDRLFGTHHLPQTLPAAYGISATLPDSLTGQLTYPLLDLPEEAPPAEVAGMCPSPKQGLEQAAEPAAGVCAVGARAAHEEN